MMKHKQALGLDYFSGLEDAQGKAEPKKTEEPAEGDAEGEDSDE
jgi:hypothetical protein